MSTAADIHDSALRHIVFVQYGDYAEAVHRFAAGGKENYYAQKYSVDHVAFLAARYGTVTVITFSRDHPFELLPNGVGARGVLLYPSGGKARHHELLRALEEMKPTDVILVAPIRSVLHWAVRRRVRTLPLFADSFLASGWKARLKEWLLARVLNDRHFSWVANHHIAASQELARIGVDPHKILPFDWPPIVSPRDYAPKDAPAGAPFKLLYVGQLSEAKGIGDALRALHLLPGCTLTVIGGGADELSLQAMSENNAIAGQVTFHGVLPHDQVLEMMRAHDAVLVPSRHEYPEGLPFTIYEALCTRTPVVASDHPMFLRRLVRDQNALVFKAAAPASLAAAVQRLMTHPDLYRALSKATGEAAENYLCPLRLHDLINIWLQGDAEGDAYLSSFSLAGHAYV
ncbi:MAG TPA: glycosyltransferase family 4 protein [Candidatus Binataceae bacterium]|nr:glycosyltransferase family 4 protein [Candidatus Binataceae bacterium]